MAAVVQALVETIRIPLTRKLALAGAGALSLFGPFSLPAAQAHDYDDRRHEDRRSHVEIDVHLGRDHCEPVYQDREVRVWVPPVYRTVCDQRWVEPIYRTVCDRRFIEPVYQTSCETVLVPDVWETREIRRVDRYRGTTVCSERVLVAPAHYEKRERRVLVSEGRWENCERQELVCAGHLKKVERQELVCDGHYETRVDRVRVGEAREYASPVEVVNPMLRGLGIQVRR